MNRCFRCGKPIESGHRQCSECSEKMLRQEEIKAGVEFDAREIASIVDQTEWILKNAGSEAEKREAKVKAYEDITGLIFNRGE